MGISVSAIAEAIGLELQSAYPHLRVSVKQPLPEASIYQVALSDQNKTRVTIGEDSSTVSNRRFLSREAAAEFEAMVGHPVQHTELTTIQHSDPNMMSLVARLVNESVNRR